MPVMEVRYLSSGMGGPGVLMAGGKAALVDKIDRAKMVRMVKVLKA